MENLEYPSPIKCSSTNYLCFINKLDENIFNSFVITLSVNTINPTISNQINISISFSEVELISFNISNIFPKNENNFTDILKILNFPSTNINQDYQFRSYSSLSIFEINNFNSILSKFYNNSFTNLILVKRNSTQSSFITYNFLENKQQFIYQIDSKSKLISTFTSSVTKLDINKLQGKILLNYSLDSTTNSILIIATSSLSYVSNYSLEFNINALNSKVLLNNWYPVSIASNNSYIYSTSIIVSRKLTGLISAKFLEIGSSSSINIPNSQTSISNISIKNMTMIKSSWNSYLFRIEINSNNYIKSIEIESFKLYPSNLIYGDTYNGIYEMNCQFSKPLPYDVKVIDEIGEVLILNTDVFINNDIISNVFTINNITSFKFVKNNLNLSSEVVNNTIHFTIDSDDKSLKPVMTPGFGLDFQGYFNKTLNLYTIDFFLLPHFMTGIFEFKLFNGHNYIDSNLIISKLGNDSQLNILQSQGDILPPIITEISAYPSTSVKYESDESTIEFGWYLTIEDFPNGFNYANIQVRSNLDWKTYNIVLNSKNRVSGDKYKGEYFFSIEIDKDCKTQEFTIGNITLYDFGASINSFDPLSTIYGSNLEDELFILVTCQEIVGRSPPKLDDLSITSSVDVGTLDRTIKFTLEADDKGSGVSERHTPYIYLTSESLETLIIPTIYLKSDDNEVTFTASYQLPFGFGVGKYFFISIYGILDNHNNYCGYSTADLKKAKLSYYIKRTFSLTTPIIESASAITNYGGTLTLYGRSFGVLSNTTVSINYQDGNGYVPATIDFQSGIIIKLINIPKIESPSIKVKVIVNGVSSNQLTIKPIQGETPSIPPTIMPTETPAITPTPKPICPGDIPCSGRGVCTNDGCQCNLPWDGPSCQSQTIILPQPSPNPEPNTNINITKNGHSILSSIKVVQVVELNNLREPVKTFEISKWNFTDKSSHSSIPTYYYETILENSSTQINVIIEFYKNETNITFGDHNVRISPSTIKFTIDLSHYEFESMTNYLQVTMESTIQADGNQCSSKYIGMQGDNVKWIKLNIDDIALYGKFLSLAMIDDRVRSIDNVLLNQSSLSDGKNDSYNQVSYRIGIIIPYYERSVTIDPDFGSIIDVEMDETSSSVCRENVPTKSQFSTWKIITIAVAGGLFIVSSIIATVIYMKQQKKNNRMKQNMEMKLRKSAQVQQQDLLIRQ